MADGEAAQSTYVQELASGLWIVEGTERRFVEHDSHSVERSGPLFHQMSEG